MKALTIKAPWAQAIVHGTNRIENRTWKPHVNVIGKRIAIHCGKSLARPRDYDDPRALVQLDEAHRWCVGTGRVEAGCIIGTAIIAGWIDDEDAVIAGSHEPVPGTWDHHILRGTYPYNNQWFIGPIGWLLDDVRAVEPVAARGQVGMWTVPENIELVEVMK